MMKLSNAFQQPWLILLTFLVFSGCTFDQAGELSTACVIDSDCTQGRVCSAQICRSPGNLVDASEDPDVSDQEPDVAFMDVQDVDPEDVEPSDVDRGETDVGPSDVGPGDVDVNPDIGPGDVDPVEPDCDRVLTNRDEVEACKDTIVFVSVSKGAPGNLGTMTSPLDKIQEGLDKAAAVRGNIKWVLVGDGLYNESIELVEGVGIAGGYSDYWERIADKRSKIRGASPAVLGEGISEVTRLAHLDIKANDVTASAIGGQQGQSVVSVLLRGSSGVVLEGVDIAGGDAGAGGNGQDGVIGKSGVRGVNGQDSKIGGMPVECGEGIYSGGGGAGGRGGNGGSVQPGVGGTRSDGTLLNNGGGTSSNLGGGGGSGGDGGPGRRGNDGSGAEQVGEFKGLIWNGKEGESGDVGLPGDGGGGGGGGRGLSCGELRCNGGGGGSGGCGGTGGGAGYAGGASVALMLVNSGAIELRSVRLSGGKGGVGGRGGAGGHGGAGGEGRTGNSNGGNGGHGGAGGQGGIGGGGAGGPSFVIVSDQPFDNLQDMNIVQGAGGAGGSGEGGNAGADGVVEMIFVQATGL